MRKLFPIVFALFATGIAPVYVEEAAAQSSEATGNCAVAGNTLASARQRYEQTCAGPRVDCDVSGGTWYCANFRNPQATVTPESTPTPAPTPAPPLAPANPPGSSANCSVAANTIASAKRLYAQTCPTPRVDCDKSGGLWYCANYNNPRTVTTPEPSQTPPPVQAPAPTQTPPPVQAPVPPIASIDQPSIDINYENGQTNSGYNEIGWTNSGVDRSSRRRITIESSGNYAIVHTEVKGDPFEAGAPRTESNTIGIPETNYKNGDSTYYGFSIYFPETWEFDGRQDDIVFQFKQFSSRPSAFVVQKYDRLYYRISNSTDDFRYEITNEPLQKGVWHDIRIHIVWSRFDNGRGKIQLDHKIRGGVYRRAFTHNGKNMHPAPAGNGYLKFGVYKPNMRKSFVNSRSLLHDNIRVGPTLESVSVY